MFNETAISYLRKIYDNSTDGSYNIVVPRELIGILLDPKDTIVNQDLLDACTRIESRYAQYHRLGMTPSDIERVITAIRDWIVLDSINTYQHNIKSEHSIKLPSKIDSSILEQINNGVKELHKKLDTPKNEYDKLEYRCKLLYDIISILNHPTPNGEFCNDKCPMFKHVATYNICKLDNEQLKSRNDSNILCSCKCKEYKVLSDQLIKRG